MRKFLSLVMILSMSYSTVAFSEQNSAETEAAKVVVYQMAQKKLAEIEVLRSKIEITQEEFDRLDQVLREAKANYKSQVTYKFRNVAAISTALGTIGLALCGMGGGCETKAYVNTLFGLLIGGAVSVVGSTLILDPSEYDRAQAALDAISAKLDRQKDDLDAVANHISGLLTSKK